jgi:hypothetical protein
MPLLFDRRPIRQSWFWHRRYKFDTPPMSPFLSSASGSSAKVAAADVVAPSSADRIYFRQNELRQTTGFYSPDGLADVLFCCRLLPSNS